MTRPNEKDFPPSRAGRLTLLGNALCLNFVNTRSGHGTERLLEHLFRFEHLLAWSRHAGAIDEATARRFEINPPSQRASLRAVDEAHALRDALHDIFSSVIHRTTPPAPALAAFNRHLATAMAAAEIVPEGEGFAWRWNTQTMPPEGLLWPVTRSAAELL